MVIKPDLLLRIWETMQKLEGFQYATALNINMGYCTLMIFPASTYTKTIVTKFGKFGYNCIPMEMCASGDTFQAKVDKLIGVNEGSQNKHQ